MEQWNGMEWNEMEWWGGKWYGVVNVYSYI